MPRYPKLPKGPSPPIRLGPSALHGIGVFTRAPLQRGQVVGHMQTIQMGSVTQYRGLPTVGIITRGGQLRAVLGGPFPFWYVNYSETPNVIAESDGTLRACVAIDAGDELTVRAF